MRRPILHRLHLLFPVIGLLIAIVLGATVLRERSPDQLTVSRTVTPTNPRPAESIESVYSARYKGVVARLNAFDHRGALEALRAVPVDHTSMHDLYFQGILYAWLGQDKVATRRLSAAAQLDTSRLEAPILIKHAKKWDLHPTTINSRHFTIEDCRYLRRCYFLQRVSDRIVSGCSSDEEKIERLLGWIFRHVAFYEAEAMAVSPMDILLRGYGLCDRSAWVLALLSERAGLPATILILGTPRQAISSHTLCQVLVSGRWVLCDTTQGTFLAFGGEGKAATLNEILLRLTLEKDNPALQEKYGEFREAGVGVVCEAEGTMPRFRLLEPYLRVIPPHSSAFVDLEARLDLAKTSISETIADGKNPIGIWDYPFLVLSQYQNPLFQARREKYLADMLVYRQARLLQLLGFPREAINLYEESAETADKLAREDILFFAAQCYVDAGDLKKAEQKFAHYLSKHPAGRWRKTATYHLALVSQQMGKPAEAIKLYRSIDEIDAARQRAEILEQQIDSARMVQEATSDQI